ncbi:uncharacterized protein BDW43DRAFT_271612 [Aspergillus alliaceus]|uniref:uncharacterized protein n=1 Tax=Petromyces alliaceus TaxID=209559 RepID=UPI0012A6B012|nr:uncharacterized protein BDW43DRAFT_271612 [Aspergillus alliaceus]KAB8234842.1 hypothetical protein BDW43DRAFT_271612 [Aspergillus alliaceus]
MRLFCRMTVRNAIIQISTGGSSSCCRHADELGSMITCLRNLIQCWATFSPTRSCQSSTVSSHWFVILSWRSLHGSPCS